jgi:ubiquinone/menaquinone biosynthesis C-methylase UbiE
METMMDAEARAMDDQFFLWNGTAGQAWVDSQELLDSLLQPIEDMLVAAASSASARSVLDIGCGTGSTTVAIARALGQGGQAVGVDVSAPMLAAARRRAEQEHVPASFVRADAETYPFEPAAFDMVVSRFGVMFFGDSVQAFANMRRAARPGAPLRFFAWRDPAENPFMTTAERAAAPFIPNLPARDPDGPGQFAFADDAKVRAILEESGWAEIDLRSIDVDCRLSERDLIPYFTRLGLLGRVLHQADDRTRSHVIETVRAAFDPFVHGAEVRFTAACWTVGAVNPGG